MKKLLILAALVLLVLNAHVSAAGIKVKNPKTDEFIYKGGNGYEISWAITVNTTENVKIRVYNKDGIKVQSLTDSVDITPSKFFWQQNLIDQLPLGEYFIRVKTINNTYFGDGGVFKIAKKLIDPEKLKEFYEKVQDKPKFPISKEVLHLKPDLKIAVGPNIQPPYHNSFFNIIVSNIGKIATPVATSDKLIFYYWGKDGNSTPNHLMEMIVTPVPVINAGSNHVHIISYKFTEPGKYTFSAHVNASEMKKFEESNSLNNSNLQAEFWVKY